MSDRIPFNELEDEIRALGFINHLGDDWRTKPVEFFLEDMTRHLDARKRGEMTDPASGLPHIAHAEADLLIVAWFDKEAQRVVLG